VGDRRPLEPRVGPEPADASAAALVALPFVAYLLTLQLVAPPTEWNWARADPILQLLPRSASLAIPPALGVLLAIAWWQMARPTAAVLRIAGKEALLGGLVALVAIGGLRLAVGPQMPAFIPREESAGPGFLLSMTAGLWEEQVCRLALLPALYFGLRGRVPEPVAVLTSLVVVGLSFSLWHLAGESVFSLRYFVTRFAIPGCGMSLIWMVSPSAIVAGHASAHLLIPAVFLAPT